MPLAGLFALLAAGCATAPGPPGGPPPEETAEDTARSEPVPPAGEARPERRRPSRPGRTVLPSIPRRRGGIDLRVEYPDSLRLVRPDSNFIFGTVGTGDARLWVDGREVEVEPNGAFLAWLPVPEAAGEGGADPEAVEDEAAELDVDGPVARYRLVARRMPEAGAGEAGAPAGDRDSTVLRDSLFPPDSVVVEHPVRRPEPGYRPPESGAWIDSTDLELPGLRWSRPGDRLTFALRAAPGSRPWLAVGEERFPLEARPGSDRYRRSLPARAVESAFCGAEGKRCLRFAEAPAVGLRFGAASEGDTARLSRELRLRVLEPSALPVAELREAPDPEHGQSGRVVGRPVPHGPYARRFPDGTRAEVTGRRGDRLRLAVPGGPPAWVDIEDAVLLPRGVRRPRATMGDLEVQPRSDRVRLEIPLASAVPVSVSRPEPDRLELRLHGVRARTERVGYGPADPLLESVEWSQEPGPAVRLAFGLADPLWGYELSWAGTAGETPVPGAGSRLVLEIRRPPVIDPDEPLRGRTVAVDPGHPGAGAHGPTGYYEGDANLAIARHLVEMLREEGARPVLIRSDTLQMGLYERTNRAVEAGAELFVSIHNNALPDGIYPFGEEGTSTYYYHPHSRELAESVQAGMLLRMGLRDLGIFWGNLAVTRMSWMPSVLAEGAFMMIPRHEAALAQPEFQRAYARGVLTGLRGFLARRARAVDVRR